MAASSGGTPHIPSSEQRQPGPGRTTREQKPGWDSNSGASPPCARPACRSPLLPGGQPSRGLGKCLGHFCPRAPRTRGSTGISGWGPGALSHIQCTGQDAPPRTSANNPTIGAGPRVPGALSFPQNGQDRCSEDGGGGGGHQGGPRKEEGVQSIHTDVAATSEALPPDAEPTYLDIHFSKC